MLVLSRKLGEEIYINDVKIKVINIGSKTIKLGIDAPKDVIITRGELKNSIEESNKEAKYTPTLEEIKTLSGLLKHDN